MRESLAIHSRPEELATEVRWQLSSAKAILIVEGKSDYSVLRLRFNAPGLLVIPTNGKNTVLGAHKSLSGGRASSEELRKVLCLIDRDDADPTLTTFSEPPRVLLTQARDLDAELASAPGVMEEVLWLRSEGGFTSRPPDFGTMAPALTTLVWLRSVSAEHGLGLNFKGVQFDEIAKRLAASDLVAWLVEHVVEKSGLDGHQRDRLQELLKEHPIPRSAKTASFQGHDIHGLVTACTGGGRVVDVQRLFASAANSGVFWQLPTAAAVQTWASECGVELGVAA